MTLMELLVQTANQMDDDCPTEVFEAALTAQAAIGAMWVAANLAWIEVEQDGGNTKRGWSTMLIVPPEDADEGILRVLGISPSVAEMMGDGYPPISLNVFCDNGIPTFMWPNRPCSYCDETPTVHRSEGSASFWSFDDPCIQQMPGVRSACCGHGLPTLGRYPQSYIEMEDETVLRGSKALKEMSRLGGHPPQ